MINFIELVIDGRKHFISLSNILGLVIEPNSDEDATCDIMLTVTFINGGSERVFFERGCGAHETLMDFLDDNTLVRIGSTTWDLPT